MTVQLTIQTTTAARLFTGVVPCMSNEETRYYLRGVFVHAHKSQPDASPVLRLVATDGHRMGIYEHDYNAQTEAGLPEFAGFIIPSDGALYISKLKAEKRIADALQFVRLTIEGERLTVETMLGSDVTSSRVFALVQGTFPDYHRCTPYGEISSNVGAFNADLVADLAKAVSKCGNGKGTPIAIAQCDNRTSPTWVATGVEGLRYVLMPMRSNIFEGFEKVATTSDADQFRAMASRLLNIASGDRDTKREVARLLDLLAEGQGRTDGAEVHQIAAA